MTGTKILVLHIRQIVKGLLVGVGLVLLLFLILIFFFGNNESQTSRVFNPGTYTAYINLNYKPATLEVTVTEDEITSIILTPLSDNQEVFYPLLTPTALEIVEDILMTQNLEINATYENAATSKVVVNAISRALELAMVD